MASRWSRAFALLIPMGLLGLSGCGPAPASLSGPSEQALPLPRDIQVAFNHREGHRYLSPVSGQWRQGDDMEAMVVRAIGEARQEVLVAVQELSLAGVARALVDRHRQGVDVRVVLENTYSTPWSQQSLDVLSPHQRQRQAQLQALGQPDAVALLRRAGVPFVDDTADGSAGSGLMHHKFLVVDRRVVVTGSANFSPSCVHGDPDDPRTRGNVNHLLRFDSAPLAEVFAEEFARLWGDGPGGAPDSRFGLSKASGPARRVMVGTTSVEVLFAPHRRTDPHHGLHWLEERLAGVQRRLDLSLFVFSAQGLADTLAALPSRGVAVRLLADPGFASRPFSEVLDVLGVSRPDGDCLLEADNQVWQRPLEGVGTPRLAGGDKLHHKFAVIDNRLVITGSFNWSPSAAHQNDETLLMIDSPLLAAHFTREMDRLWRGAEVGVSGRMARGLAWSRQRCGRGRARPSAFQSRVIARPSMEQTAAAP
ncbi:MAG: phosphatidylserine/phosphatidylglycerophosphate/cardiolipin synthase family protein [Cyanobacteriota bacterium]|nr:phosphatidylserine/phosphatidylglycerophosphate/cardiolipin synthase family protein [Cyanobacteriota bacterium]